MVYNNTQKITLLAMFVIYWKHSFNFSGRKTPFSVMIPAIKEAGVISKAGFQQEIPEIKFIEYFYITYYTIKFNIYFVHLE